VCVCVCVCERLCLTFCTLCSHQKDIVPEVLCFCCCVLSPGNCSKHAILLCDSHMGIHVTFIFMCHFRATFVTFLCSWESIKIFYTPEVIKAGFNRYSVKDSDVSELIIITVSLYKQNIIHV